MVRTIPRAIDGAGSSRFLPWCLAVVLLSCSSAAKADDLLIFGGTGHTGSRITKHLVERGFPVSVFVRPTSSRARLEGLAVNFVVGDVTDARSVEAAFERVQPDIVIAVLQSRRGQPSPHGEPEVALVRWAERVGAKQFIYLSSVGAGPDTLAQRARYPDINFDRFAAGLELKHQAEQALLASSVAHTIIRSGSILVEFGREPPPGTGRGYFTEDQDVMGAITYDDLALLMSRCVGLAACFDKIYHTTDDTLGPEYNHWRCRRFAKTRDLDAECDHLRPIDNPAVPRPR